MSRIRILPIFDMSLSRNGPPVQSVDHKSHFQQGHFGYTPKTNLGMSNIQYPHLISHEF